MTNIQTTQNTQQHNQAIAMMRQHKGRIGEILPDGLSVDKLIAQIGSQIKQNPKLGLCDPISMMWAVMTCAQIGLTPSKTLGRVHLIPFKNGRENKYEVQVIIGYQGLVELARRSGDISEIYAEVVYNNDRFEYEMGLNKRLVHEPVFEDQGEFKCVYAVAKYANGGNHIVVMGKDEIERIQNSTKFPNPVWKTHFDEMAKKTAIRRLAKLLPLTIELEKAATFVDAEHSESTIDHSAELEADGIKVLEVESEENKELSKIVDAIKKKFETVPDSVFSKKTGKSKQDFLDKCTDLEAAKNVLNIAATL